MTELLKSTMAKLTEAAELLDWVEFVKWPDTGWLVIVCDGKINEIIGGLDDDDYDEGKFWAPTLREALRKAKAKG